VLQRNAVLSLFTAFTSPLVSVAEEVFDVVRVELINYSLISLLIQLHFGDDSVHWIKAVRD
jgi:hypothetical protein